MLPSSLRRTLTTALPLLLLVPARAGEPRVDLHGDPLPEGATGRLGTMRWRHILRDGSGFGVVSVSRDGKYVASVGDVGPRVWNLGSGREETWLKPGPSVRAARFTPDGKRLLTASGQVGRGGRGRNSDRARWLVQHWEPGTGKLLRRAEITTSGDWTSGFAQFSPDGKLFMCKDGEKQVGLWDAATGERVARIDQGTTYWDPLALSPDNKALAVAAHDGHVYLYDVAAGKRIHKLARPRSGPTDWHYAPAFSPDGKVLVTSGRKSLFVWDAASGKLLHEGKGCRGPAAFSADGKLLACGAGKRIHLFNAATFQEVRRFDGYRDQYVIALAFSADGKWLIAGQAFTIALWDLATGRQLNASPGHQVPVASLAFSPDGKALASGGDGDGTAYVWDLATGRPRHRFPGHHPSVPSLAFSPGGGLLATGEGFADDGIGGNEARVQLWDLRGGRPEREFVAHLASVRRLAFARDGKTLASGGNDARARVWEVATGHRLSQLRNAARVPRAIDLSPDGEALLMTGPDDELSLWRADTGEKLLDLGPPGGRRSRQVSCAALLPGGRAVISREGGDRDGPSEFRLWDARTGKLLRSSKAPRAPYHLYGETFSPDGTTYAAASEDHRNTAVQLWDTETGKLLTSLRGHEKLVTALAFSPDGKTLASGSRDTTVLLWDVARARLEGLWNDLGEGEQATRRMAADPGQAVPFLTGRLARAAAAEKNVRRLLADLDANRFPVRERATQELEKLGALAEPALRRALEGELSPEARGRMRRVLEGIRKQPGAAPYSPDRLRAAVRLLEVIGGGEARQALKELAAGDEGLTVTQLARPALERLKKKDPGR